MESPSTLAGGSFQTRLDDLARTGADERLKLVLVDRGTAQSAAQRLSNKFNYEVRRVGWDEPPRNEYGAKIFRAIRHAWRVEVAHGRLVRRRRLTRCFENTVTSGRADRHPLNHHGIAMRALGRNRILRRGIIWEVGR